MNIRKWSIAVIMMALAAGLAVTEQGSARQRETPQPPAAPNAQSGVEVLARGPVHEAFAEPTETRPVPSPVVAKEPPAPIEEMPPDQKPQGDNVTWIPGYWGWDSDQNDYVWVSGFWRDVPPSRQWVPGQWQQVQDGWQWSPGFWGAAEMQDIDYLPPPPPSVDNGPSSAAPDDQSVYVPGCWIYHETRYLWRPGFWMALRPDWVWIPAHYVWTPVGCIFVDGYWDYPLYERGLLFSPVRFARGFALDARFVFTPQYCVQPDFLLTALFVHPATCHYYFGDYFDDRYARAGFVPWIDYHINRFGLDPNYAFYRHAVADRAWETRLRQIYDGRRRGELPRPPHTLAQQTQMMNQLTAKNAQNDVIRNLNVNQTQLVSALAPVNQVQNIRITNLATSGTTRAGAPAAKTIRMERIDRARLSQIESAAKQNRVVAEKRREIEAKSLSEGKVPIRHTDQPLKGKLDLPRSISPPAHGQENKLPTTTPPARGREERPPVHGSETKPPTQPPATQPPTRNQEERPPASLPPARNLERQPNRQPPPLPNIPRHEERQVPQHEPFQPSRPPTKPKKDHDKGKG